jgi:hypothetical protein
MYRKRFKTLIVAVLLAFSLSTLSPLPTATSTVLAAECGTTASGCSASG